MRVLGLDPGLRHTGWGVIDVAGNRLSYVADGVVHAPTDLPLADRLVVLFRQLINIIERFRPDERGLPVAEYSANLVKKSVVGAGHAEKAQVQLMVRRLLPGCAIATPDAADALAVAICHAHHAGTARIWQPVRVSPAQESTGR